MTLSKAFTMDGAHETILRSGVYKSEFYMLSEQLLFLSHTEHVKLTKKCH